VREPPVPDVKRREFLVTTLATAGAVAASPAASRPAEEKPMDTPSVPGAFAEIHEPKPLPFNSGSLKGLSAKLIESHWANNYGGSVKTLNAVKQKLAQALADPDVPPAIYSGLKREHLLRTGSIVLHELYFENLGGDGRPGADLRSTLAAAFGRFDGWEAEFRRIALGLGGGSGWVMLARNAHLGTLENYWLWDHMHCPAGAIPLLVLDMYEHSYQMDYGAAAAKYVDAFFENINWDTIAARWHRGPRLGAG
jgi:Fe-Mn family superoxide dismutase